MHRRYADFSWQNDKLVVSKRTGDAWRQKFVQVALCNKLLLQFCCCSRAKQKAKCIPGVAFLWRLGFEFCSKVMRNR